MRQNHEARSWKFAKSADGDIWPVVDPSLEGLVI